MRRKEGGHGDKVALAYDPRQVELGRVALREQVWGRSLRGFRAAGSL